MGTGLVSRRFEVPSVWESDQLIGGLINQGLETGLVNWRSDVHKVWELDKLIGGLMYPGSGNQTVVQLAPSNL